MDTTDPDIVFDAQGVCNHCHRYNVVSRQRLIAPAERKQRLDALVAEIKHAGRGKPYDCIIGVSGGVDSTYVAWVVKISDCGRSRCISTTGGIPNSPSPT